MPSSFDLASLPPLTDSPELDELWGCMLPVASDLPRINLERTRPRYTIRGKQVAGTLDPVVPCLSPDSVFKLAWNQVRFWEKSVMVIENQGPDVILVHSDVQQRCITLEPNSEPYSLRSGDLIAFTKASAVEDRRFSYVFRQLDWERHHHHNIHLQYDFYRPVAKGGGGVVFLATSRDSGERVAIKSLRDKGSFQEGKYARFKSEAAMLRKFEGPYVCKILDSFPEEGDKMYYIVLEYFRHGNLGDYLSYHAEPSLRRELEAKKVMMMLLRVVSNLHNAHILHRDIKPDNVLCLLDDNMDIIRVKLTDFGISKEVDPDGTRRTFTGTGPWMSPEVKEASKNGSCPEDGDKTYSYPADIWSLGRVLIALATCVAIPTEFDVDLATNEHYQEVTDQCKDLIRRMSDLRPTKRITAREALEHKWFEDLVLDDPTEEPALATAAEEQPPLLPAQLQAENVQLAVPPIVDFRSLMDSATLGMPVFIVETRRATDLDDHRSSKRPRYTHPAALGHGLEHVFKPALNRQDTIQRAHRITVYGANEDARMDNGQ